MMADARAGKFDMIVCASVSRFARNVSDCINYVNELRTMNPHKPIGVYFETENIFTLNKDADQTLGFHALLADWESRFWIIKDVIIPKVKYTMCEMFVYFFVNSMMTISAVSFLAPPAPKPIALMINQFEAQRLMESAAFVSLLILLINVAVKIVMLFIRKRADKIA